jgi:uncharacterized protein (TIGR03437 family)
MAAAHARLRGPHESAKAELRARNIRITGEVDTLLNAVFVAADSSQAGQLQSVAGVRYVAKMPRLHRSLDAAEQLINVPSAWNLLGGSGNAGAGIRIGVIDTGIDSSHAAFQDPSLTAPSPPVCDVIPNCAFTNNKIIVARSFVAMVAMGSDPTNPSADSRPDDYSARDRVGHGTAVAMAAAGVTNTGPSDTIAGVAPKAFLGSYKVFGSPGVIDFTSGDAVIAALDAAYNDQMDIVVLSLGGPAVYPPVDAGSTCPLNHCDALAFAVQNAVDHGMLVVAAAGNEGSGLGSLDSPGDAPGAIAVAAVTNAHNWSSGLTVNGLGNFHSALGNGPPPTGVLTGPLSDAASVGDPQACSTLPGGSLTGTIALVQRLPCDFAVKVQNLQAAGAVGVIITNSQDDDSILSPGGLAGFTSIPAAFIGYDDGQAIRGYLNANPKATASLNANLVSFPVTNSNQMASFSSRGPTLGGAGPVKPDVAAVGTNLYLAAQKYDPNGDLYSANGYIVSQGTSFSTPQVAGLAALVLQTNRALTPAQIKSAIVNTATADTADGGALASVLAAGSGRANAGAAVAASLFASPSSVSFGAIKSDSLPATQLIQLTNLGASSLSLSVSFNRRTAETTAHISVDPNIQIAAGATGTITLTLSGTTPAPGIYEGFVVIQQSGINLLQIPFVYIVPDGVPARIVTIAGNGDVGIVDQQNSEGGILFQVLDQYGVPVSGLPATFSALTGGGSVFNSDQTTDDYGFAGSNDTLGLNPGTNIFTGSAGGLSTNFAVAASAQPTIFPAGAVNAANYANQPVAPGSYIAVFGTNLAKGSTAFSTQYLPVSIGGTSVSFDTPSLSAAGHLTYASPGLVVVQVPWELQTALAAGQTAAQIKTSISFDSGAVYNLPLASYSPAFFEISTGFVAALDQNNQLVTASNGVAQGSTVQLFLNGLGPVTNQPTSGDPASLTVQSTTPTTPAVKIGGLDAAVPFSGLAPGEIGLYQVNAVVPNTGPGLQTITITIGGVASTVSHIQVR